MTSTVRSGGVNFPNAHMESPIMNVRPIVKTSDPQTQNGWNRSRIGNPGLRNRTLEAQHGMNRIVDDRNEEIIVENKTLSSVSRQAVQSSRGIPMLPRSPALPSFIIYK